MKLKLRNYLFMSCLTVAFIACREKSLEIQIQMLPGNYCLNEGNQNDSLFLYDSKTYTHKFFLSESKVFKSKGKWDYDSVAKKISFYDFIFYNENGPTNPSGGVWHSKVHVTNDGEVRLIYSRENGIFYYKNRILVAK